MHIEDLKRGKIGLVLCGGGFKGAYQIGVWKALKKIGIEHFEAIAGTSVGALNAILIANNEPEVAEAVWTNEQLLRFSPKSWVKYLLGYLLLFGPFLGTPFVVVFEFFMPTRSLNLLLLNISIMLSLVSIVISYLIMLKSISYKVLFFINPTKFILGSLLLLPTCLAVWKLSLINKGFPSTTTPTGFMLSGFVFIAIPLGILIGTFGLILLDRAQRKGQLFSNADLVNAIKENLNLDAIKRNVQGLYVTTARGASYFDPFDPRLDFDLDLRTLVEVYLPINPGGVIPPDWLMNETEWIPEYHDLCQSHTQMQIIEKLKITSAFPFVLSAAVSSKNELIVDGGIIDNMPILPLLLMDIDSIIILCLDSFNGDKWRKLQSYIDFRWKRCLVPIFEIKEKAMIPQNYEFIIRWIDMKSGGGVEWDILRKSLKSNPLKYRPLIGTKQIYIIAPTKPLVKWNIWPLKYITGTFNFSLQMRKAWIKQGEFDSSIRTIESIINEE